MSAPEPIALYDRIKVAYLKYIDTAYWLRDEGLMAERRRLLEGGTFSLRTSYLNPFCPMNQTSTFEQWRQRSGFQSEFSISSATPSLGPSAPLAGHTCSGATKPQQ